MNPIGWFEIPVSNMERAIDFYQNVFQIELNRQQLGPADMAWFPMDEKASGASGSLIHEGDSYEPGGKGTLVYFSCEDVATQLTLAEANNGTVEIPKKLIAEGIGYMGTVIDTEGNRIAFHSRQ